MATGELTDGQLLMAAGDDDKVQLVLAGATIHNEDGPAIYVQNADKCFVTLADGAENTLTDGADYALEADSDELYATLFSRCDLTLNGGGTLNVTAAYRHAVCSKDDLTVVSGTYNISAAEDGLRGRDSVKIRDGVFSIAAGGDGIKSNKDSKPTKGFVSIDGGTFDSRRATVRPRTPIPQRPATPHPQAMPPGASAAKAATRPRLLTTARRRQTVALPTTRSLRAQVGVAKAARVAA